MKIALVSEHANPLPAHKGEPTDGESVHLSCLARQLARLGHRVTVYTRCNDPELAERARMGRGVTVEPLTAGPRRPLEESEYAEHTADFATALTGMLDADVPDVVHAFGWSSGLAAMVAARDSGHDIPITQSFHSLNVSEQRAGLPRRPDRVRLEAALAQNAGSVLVNSADQRFELARMGVPRGHVSVVPYGVDAEHFSVEGGAHGPWQNRRSASDQQLRIIAVTDLGVHGGADALIDTMARVPEGELVIVGGPDSDHLAIDPDARRLELRAKEVGVDGRVTLTGAVDRKELPRLLRSADVFVSAASYDPYGGAVLEAMACGLPVVARAVGSVTGAMLDGTTGVLLRSSRPDSLARALRQLAGDSTRRTACGIAAADRAASRFGWPRVASETVRAYTRLLPVEVDLPLAAGDDAH
ncbi:glycosyltransferase [Actinorugispora endophytica]|uniref:Glycosyltransferase involved in cell wall biosynthesis n=1 Tax=Actinorugispora endophytica TaxID=1605990 RepID=A0A4R6V780_9ACTN|nr:glycosyltransferase [Actinorugispora endophytica]TDQ55072.1 glycosyltransferase involved in cell wall biosynthesis [Actinorugispora endophytica]